MTKERSKINIRNTKVRDFLICLGFALLAWMVSRLSETYTGDITVNVTFVQIPDSLILVGDFQETFPVRIRANGFQTLRYHWSTKKVTLNLSGIKQVGNRFYLSNESLRNQLGSQFSAKSSLLGIGRDTLFVNLQKMETKTIPVRVVIDLDLAQNFMLDGGVHVDPEKVRISGPSEEIDTIYELKTRPVQLQNLNSDFIQNIELATAPELKRTNFSHQNVTLTGRVIRFSEVLLEVPVTVINLPENLVIKTFPPSVAVLCSGGVDAIKNLTAEGFKIEADYRAPDSQSGRLQLVLSAYPEGLRTVQLQEQSVEYIVRRE
jgi:hypothetical protein